MFFGFIHAFTLGRLGPNFHPYIAQEDFRSTFFEFGR
jgi:hypothetical protein